MARHGTTPWLLLLLGALSCAPTSGAVRDRDAYLSVVSGETGDAAQAQATCSQIGEEALRGDCLVYLVSRLAVADPAAVCREAPTATWRDECSFAAAERSRMAGDLKGAATLCLTAGLFRDDCSQHLWQNELRGAIQPPRGPPTPAAVADALPRAERVRARWEGLLGADTDLDARFWPRFYQMGFDRLGTVDLTMCSALTGVDLQRCVDAGAWMVTSRLGGELRDRGVEPCGLDGLASVAPMLRLAPDPRLDAALSAWQAESCQ